MRAASLVLGSPCSCAPREAAAVLRAGARGEHRRAVGHQLRPLLARRFPRATASEVLEARAYAYGGSVIQDLGYYPFGSHFFSNLVHYVRTGDFVEALIREARDVNEYAFALGALAHYTADNVGHPEGVNRAVALMYPKLRAKYGDSVTYADSPATPRARRVLVRRRAGGRAARYVSDTYQCFIGFQVAKPVLERAFLRDLRPRDEGRVPDEDLAIGSYRHAISADDSARSRASRGATSARRSQKLHARARRRSSSSSTCRAQEYEQGLRHRLPEAGPAGAVPGVPLQAAAEGRPAAAAAVQGADAGGRGAVSRELQGHARALSRGARRARRAGASICRTPISTPASRARTASTRWPTRPTPSCCTG